jgi:hypothetical protein
MDNQSPEIPSTFWQAQARGRTNARFAGNESAPHFPRYATCLLTIDSQSHDGVLVILGATASGWAANVYFLLLCHSLVLRDAFLSFQDPCLRLRRNTSPECWLMWRYD